MDKDSILSVKLDEQKVDKRFGIPDDYKSFLVTVDDGDGFKHDIRVPLHPENPNYQLVREWYKEQKKKPFEFRFKSPPKE